MKPDVDIAIVGGGCAGLSLAAALANEQVPGTVAILEPRTRYARDRTWCFWNTEPHPFSRAVSHTWASWRVSQGTRAALQQSQTYRYCHLASDDFYQAALAIIERAPGQQWHGGTSVDSLERRPDGLVAVETSSGRLLARHAFDSRPAGPFAAAAPALLQRFVGWHVRTEADAFTPETVELMHFLPSGLPGRTRFLYLLPFSRREALVEMTYLDDPGLPPPPCGQDLRTWLDAHTQGWRVLFAEQGSLPMGGSSPRSASPGNIHAIGVSGGRIKASSGYAFMRIQRHSRLLAQALRRGRPLPAQAESPLYSRMDAVFLRAIGRSAEAAPELFLEMFCNAAPDALVRFLSETSRLPEMLRVAFSLPKLPMLGAAYAGRRSGFRTAMPAAGGSSK